MRDTCPTYVRPAANNNEWEYGLVMVVAPGKDRFIPIGIATHDIAQIRSQELIVSGRPILDALEKL